MSRETLCAGREESRLELQVWIPEDHMRRDGTTYVAVVGACEMLGDWNPEDGVAMREGEGGRWVLYELPEDIPCGTEYKYVIMNGATAEDPNCDAELSADCSSNAIKCVQFESGVNRRWPRIFDWSSPPPEHLFSSNEPNRGWEPCDPIALAEGPEIKLQWGSAGTCGDKQPLMESPCAIFHAFHWQFADVKERVSDIAQAGFDAVQISPAQRSPESLPESEEGEKGEKDKAWWLRYQPINYWEIHGLGSEEDLRAACDACQKENIRVIADVVFNHMVVVGSAAEWDEAQNDSLSLEILKRKLEAKVRPAFDRTHFQWPWSKLEGDLWDQSPSRFDGWGNGEWSTLDLYSPSVVNRHKQHLRLLQKCGCTGFRIDAAKHMRPDVVANYKRLAESVGEDTDIFVYAEVLSNDATMHQEYQHATPPVCEVPVRRDSEANASLKGASVCSRHVSPSDPETHPLATTDFQLAVWLRRLIDGGEIGWPRLRCKLSNTCYEAPLVARNSIRFIRNHDTVGNEENIGGLGGLSLRAASVATAWLLAVHDGIPLVLADDVLESKLIRQAARYRQQVKAFLQKMPPDHAASIWTDVRVRGARKGRQPGLVCIAIRERICNQQIEPCERSPDVNNQCDDGPCIGFAVLNPTIDDAAGRYNGAKHGLTLTFRGSVCLEGSAGMKFAAIVDTDVALQPAKNTMAVDAARSLVAGDSVRLDDARDASFISIAPGGRLLDVELSVPPSSGVFFLRSESGTSSEVPISIEKDFVSWSIIDAGFNTPGTSIQKQGVSLEEGIQVDFTLLTAETAYGQQIILCGSTTELGAWSPEKGIVLTTDPDSYPAWRCSVIFSKDSLTRPICYKYICDYRGCRGGFDWEYSEENRSVHLSVEKEPTGPCKEDVEVSVNSIAEIKQYVSEIHEHDLENLMGA